MKTIEEQLMLHEGLRKFPYKDSVGKLTIGVGRNLVDKGITEQEAEYLLQNDIQEIVRKLIEYNWFCELSPVRQKVIIDMSFNMGVNGVLGFQNMIRAIKGEDYKKAAEEMKDSLWHKQVKTRAERLEKMMETGEDYEL